MISIVWRGAGILVPILFFVSGFITSYWYDDVTLGNTEYMKWTLLGPGILLTIIGLFLLPVSKDPETGKWKYAGNHDLFWIPMVVWGVLFLGFSIKFFTADSPVDVDAEYKETYEEFEDEASVASYPMNEKKIGKDERAVRIYNPTDEPITIYIYAPGEGDDALSGEVPAKDDLFIVLQEGEHVVQFDNTKRQFSVTASITTDNYDSDDVWIVLDDKMDFILVDVNSACVKGLTQSVLKETDWSTKIYKRYDGEKAIFMDVKQTEGKYFSVKKPYYNIPLSHTNEEQVYSIIPIDSDVEATDEFIEEFLISICWKTEGVTIH
tara:strand:+ start:4106 stop:5071 length:966 start_codon:yes stop_codon:yes gene_type:complete